VTVRYDDLDDDCVVDVGGVAATARAVGLLLRRARENQELMQSQVAQRCGISTSVLCRLERARREPRLTVLLVLAGALGVRLSDVLRAAEDEAFPLGPVPWSPRSAELLNQCEAGGRL
jgi:transcriptional regulator with XRE-family HTH domain